MVRARSTSSARGRHNLPSQIYFCEVFVTVFGESDTVYVTGQSSGETQDELEAGMNGLKIHNADTVVPVHHHMYNTPEPGPMARS
jgi:hypothetical protein